MGVYMGPKWKVGALGMHYWDFAGDGDRSDVNLTNLQYFVYYSLDETTSIGASPNIITNWEQFEKFQASFERAKPPRSGRRPPPRGRR